MIKIDRGLLDRVSGEARVSARLRKNYNFHTEYSDPLQRLLNAMEPLSYVQPHKHEDPDKREAFLVLRGRVVVLEFDESGHITGHMLLDPATGSFGAEISERTYHMIIAIDPGTIVYEVKDGPYSPIDDKNFAAWAPKEGEAGAVDYLKGLLKKMNIEY